jgi:elongation factor 1-alpha
LDYVFLVISADSGITKNSKMFLKFALEMNLPIITIITKIDIINEYDVYDLLDRFNYTLKSLKKGKNPLIAKSKDDIVTFSRNIKEGILPIFLVILINSDF